MDAPELTQVLDGLLIKLVSELRRERQRYALRELEKEFLYGAMLAPRLRAGRRLHPIEKSDFKDWNFNKMYREMAIEHYADIAAVLNWFRLLNSYKEAGDIDVSEARRAFGWMYKWWWTNVLEHYSKGLDSDPDWQPYLKKHDWLFGD
jgi:hypothetical protein